MQDKCKLISWNVPKFSYTVQPKLQKGHQIEATFNTEIGLGISEKDNDKGSLFIEVNMSDKIGEINYCIKIKGIFEFTDIYASKEEKENILKDEAFIILYKKMCETLTGVIEKTQQFLPSLPEIDEINPFAE